MGSSQQNEVVGEVSAGRRVPAGVEGELPQEVVVDVGRPLDQVPDGGPPRAPVDVLDGAPQTALHAEAVPQQQQDVALHQMQRRLQGRHRRHHRGRGRSSAGLEQGAVAVLSLPQLREKVLAGRPRQHHLRLRAAEQVQNADAALVRTLLEHRERGLLKRSRIHGDGAWDGRARNAPGREAQALMGAGVRSPEREATWPRSFFISENNIRLNTTLLMQNSNDKSIIMLNIATDYQLVHVSYQRMLINF